MLPNRYTITVPSAWIKWGYQDAAELKVCTLTITAERSDLTATIVSLDSFRMSQDSLKLHVQKPTWKWPVVSMEISGQTLTATLGPQE